MKRITHPSLFIKSMRAIIILLVLGFSSLGLSAQSVQVIGAVKQVKQLGRLAGKVQLDTLTGKNLYGLGPVAYLQGEILLWNDTTYVSQVSKGKNIVGIIPVIQAPFLVYASVAEWGSRQVLDQTITTLPQLQQIIEQKAVATGRSLDEPFPFTLKGKAQKIIYHVMDKPEAQSEHNPKLHQQAKRFFTLVDEEVTLLGFYSRQHEGVFTHHGSFIHVHVINQARTNMGHLDELNIQPGELSLGLPLQ
ncbi:acetolactate decarboxylase [Tunicatimonas pelagia]|uniref:acetolactate decarboxylase n=1 Tax=Tunicatimonas pelagia TaxID=931531 RepID=UPI002665257D|nr:acetolactate decarboxylase [Tunicatimonas pelagia]WKN44138.1 acetolactate decarboxylase [Tunicatimonas pelagia]